MVINDLMFSLIDSLLAQLKHLSPLKPLNQYEFSLFSESRKNYFHGPFRQAILLP